MDPIRLVLIDDHTLFRESLSRFFSSESEVEVVGQCATAAELLSILQKSVVDLILLDFNLNTEAGTDLITSARQAGYSGRFLMVTGGTTAPQALNALQLGASGIFLKHNSPDSLLKAIRQVASGEVWLDRRVVQLLAERVLPGQNEFLGLPLTGRERQVLHGVLLGSSNREIAQDLGASEGAVKASIQQLFRKTGVRTRSQLVRVALEGPLQPKR